MLRGVKDVIEAVGSYSWTSSLGASQFQSVIPQRFFNRSTV
jgi:hypothetical protein